MGFANGDGTWTATNQLAGKLAELSQEPGAQAWAGDYNGDGVTDIALVGGVGWTSVPVGFANGDGTWRVTNYPGGKIAELAQEPGARVLVGDFNHDGRSDLALVGGIGWTSAPVGFANGDGTWTVTNKPAGKIAELAQEPGAKVLAGDVNGDGRTDVILVGGFGWRSAPVGFANGDGTWTVTNQLAGKLAELSQELGAQAFAADFNGDGRTDVALVAGLGWRSAPVGFSNGDGTWTVTNQLAGKLAELSQEAGARPLLGDFNGDGKADIALVGGLAWTSAPVGFSNGDGTWTVTNKPAGKIAELAQELGARALAGDFNSDGRTDVALVGGLGWTSAPVGFANGDGTWTVTNSPAGKLAELSQEPGATPVVGVFSRAAVPPPSPPEPSSCSYSVSPSTTAFGVGGGSASASVVTTAGCSWAASSSATGWLTIAAGGSQNGSGTVHYAAAANAGLARVGTLTVAGRSFKVAQAGDACGAVDVTAGVDVQRSSFAALPPLYDLVAQVVRVSNKTAQSIPGPVYLIMDGLPRYATGICQYGCGLVPAPPLTYCQSPGGSHLVEVSAGALAPNQSVTLTLNYAPASGNWTQNFAYTLRVVSGTPNR